MHLRRSDIILGIVILLLVIVVVSQYVLYHSANTDSTPGLVQYLMGLDQSPSKTASSTQASTNPSSTATTQSPADYASTPAAKPYLYALSPASGSSELTVTVVGTGFDPEVNYVTFGYSDGKHSINGLPDNVVAAERSSDGKALTFNVPLDGPNGLLCDATGKNCSSVAPTVLPAGAYPVTVSSRGGVSNTLWFTLIR